MELEVTVLRLMNGELIIGKVIDNRGGLMTLRDILAIQYGMKNQTEMGFVFFPYDPMTQDEKEIDLDHVTYVSLPKPALLEKYKKAISPIAQPDGNIITR